MSKLIYNRQFGFRSSYSSKHTFIGTTENMKNELENSNFVGGIFIDLENILCGKLSYYSFRCKIVNLIKSFVVQRQQHVSINGEHSLH